MLIILRYKNKSKKSMNRYAIDAECEANSSNLLNGCITRVKGARMSKQENHLSRENDEKNIRKRGS